MDIPVAFAGSATIVFLVGFGVFLYPWLLARPYGVFVVAALTVALTALFYVFDNPAGSDTVSSAGLGLIWALLPVGTGLLVKRIRDRAAMAGKDASASEDVRGDANG